MLWIGQAFSTPAFLKSRLIFGYVVGIAATMFFTWILFQMERNNASYMAALIEAQMGDRDTQLELEEETEEKKHDDDGGGGSQHDYVQAGNEADFAFSSSSSSSPTSYPKNSSLSDDGPLYKPGDSRRRSLTRSQQITIVLHVSVLILLNYILLVFLPGSAVLAFVAMIAIWILALHSYLRDELQRRERWDRLFTLVALFFVIAGCLTLITYCRLALHDGNVYQGPARIVGYDLGVYDNTDEETLRADVEVTWGGSWGCPDNGDRVCTATVQGALCETEYKAEDYAMGDDTTMVDDYGGDRRRRHRPLTRRFLNSNANATQNDAAEGAGGDQEEFTDKENQEMETKEEKDEEVYDEEVDSEYEEVVVEDEEIIEEEANEEVVAYEEEVSDEAEDEVEEYEDELDEEYDEEVEAVEDEKEVAEEEVEEVEELEGESGDGELIEENSELNQENEDLEEDLEDEEDYAEELEDEIDALTGSGGYSYDDDAFEDEYWNTADWDSVWGEYACEDLFDEELDGKNFDPDMAPGQDEWPTIEIYGSCNSCEAYIADYYSSEHYLRIRLYEVQSWLYLWVGFFGLIISAFAALRQHFRPSKENEVVLLTHGGGVPA